MSLMLPSGVGPAKFFCEKRSILCLPKRNSMPGNLESPQHRLGQRTHSWALYTKKQIFVFR